MIGSIIGDIIGSRFEFHNTSDAGFELFAVNSTFTDDTVLTLATADAILSKDSFLKKYQSYYNDHPNRGYGGMFEKLAKSGSLSPYNSYGNGSAMRVAPIGWAFDTYDEVMANAGASASATHNHPEGIRGAQTAAVAILMGRAGKSKEDIVNYMANNYNIRTDTPLHQFSNRHQATCQNTLPLCMALFRDSENFEDAIRKSILHGGDVDTNACIVGGIAEAFYGIPPQEMINEAFKKLEFGLRKTATAFIKSYCYEDFEEPSTQMNEQEKLQDALRSLWS